MAKKSPRRREKEVHYLLPLQWSLYFVMTKGEWEDFRNRVKAINPNWQICSCPQGCRADSCDERWEYDQRRHIKRFIEAQFICRGCHWLKTPPVRVQTWLKQESEDRPQPINTPHIIRCLGWTEEQVQKLREMDLEEWSLQNEQMEELEEDVRKGKSRTAYWGIELSKLKRYRYSAGEIASLETRMVIRAQARG